MAASNPMMTITTSNSRSVNPCAFLFGNIPSILFSWHGKTGVQQKRQAAGYKEAMGVGSGTGVGVGVGTTSGI